MVIPKAQIIEKNGRKEFAVLPYKDFLRLQRYLEDYEDLCCLREAKQREKDAPTLGVRELKRKLAGPTTRGSRRAKPEG